MVNRIVFKSVDECRPYMRSGDVLLTRGEGFISGIIRAYTGHEETHAALLDTGAKWQRFDDPMPVKVHEVREWVGAQSIDIAEAVAKAPGRIDFYRLDPHNRWGDQLERNAVVRKARSWTSRKMPYGYLTVILAFFLHLPFVRFLTRRDTRDFREWAIFPDCSAFVSGCLQYGGLDPVPNLSHRSVEPGHLGNSLALEYESTLVP